MVTPNLSSLPPEVLDKGKQARAAAFALGQCGSAQKNFALAEMAKAVGRNAKQILAGNKLDIEAAVSSGMSTTLVDRLMLSENRIIAMTDGLREVAALPDPIGEVIEGWTRPNGLRLQKMRVPLGVVGIIYEARPNVTVEAAGLCLKGRSEE